MMQKVFNILFFFLIFPALAAATGTVKSDIPKVNPHDGNGHCDLCHVASRENLDSWFTFPSTKKKMRLDYNATCRQCHGVEFGHGVGKKAKMNKENLPMDAEGKIACAITCHDMHVKAKDPEQARYHLRATQMELCLSCHKN